MKAKMCREQKHVAVSEGFDIFRERRCHFSLRSRAIGPSEFFGPRRKAVLRSEGNRWAPVSWSFDKLHEVGVLSYLFYPFFKYIYDA